MFTTAVITPFIKEVRRNPDKTLAKIGDKIITNAQFTQHIAPIMNELDAISQPIVGVVTKPEISIAAALFACAFSNVTAVLIDPQLSDIQVDILKQELNFSQMLTVERIHYYFRTTFEDALCRIDNGLYDISDDKCLFINPLSIENAIGELQKIYAGDFKTGKQFAISNVFQQILPKNHPLCSIF